MNDQLPMFDPPIWTDTPNVISSPESGYGASLSGASPDGQTTGQSGPAPAPASRSARQAGAKRSTTKGIYGQSSFVSSRHEILSASLASKYQALTASLGSTLYKVTWITRVTPAGHSIPAQRASAHRTSGSVCIGWPTPQEDNANNTAGPSRVRGMANGGYLDLSVAASLSGWASPKERDFKTESEASTSPERMAEHNPDLSKQAMLTAWTTPQKHDAQEKGSADRVRRHGTQHGCANLQDEVCLTAWATPNVPNGGRISGNPEDIGKKRDGSKDQVGLENQARLAVFGREPIGYLLGPNGWEIVPAFGQLNPAHSRWLMGLPPVFCDCAVTAMESLRRKPRRSPKS
jgi:hypothetical protein